MWYVKWISVFNSWLCRGIFLFKQSQRFLFTGTTAYCLSTRGQRKLWTALLQNRKGLVSYLLALEPNSENCLDLIFVASPCEKAIIVPNYITSAIRTLMLDIPGPGSFQNEGLYIWAQQGSEHVNPCFSNKIKIEETQLKISWYRPIEHWIMIKNVQRAK